MNNKKTKAFITPTALILLMTAFLPVAVAAPKSVDVLFLAYDQGESNAFMRIHNHLDALKIPYGIIAFGRAAEIFKDHPALLTFNDLSQDQNLRNNRDTRLPIEIINTVIRTTSTKIIYTGMASKAQAQMTNAFVNKGSQSIAFYDNFDPVSTKEYTQPFLQELKRVDAFHIPSEITASSFSELEKSKQAKLVVTGQPALETWDDIFVKANPSHLRKQLGISEQQPVALFAGGYNGDYTNSFRIFLQAAKKMPDILFIVKHHPKYSGELEKKLIQEEAVPNIKLITDHSFSTPELCTLASAVVVHKSTIAQQALYKHKPVIYVADSSFSNFIIEQRLAHRVYNPDALTKELTKLLENKEQNNSLSTLKMPDNPSRNISEHLQNILNESL